MSQADSRPIVARRSELGVQQVADQLHSRLQQYLEAQYHIRDAGLIEERRAMLREAGTIGQSTYLETTPTYATGERYSALGLPGDVGEILDDLARWSPGVGIYQRPYIHQARAIAAVLADHADVVVATGTGSGKTEAFLIPILGRLLLESARSRESFSKPAMRALLLYPMNSLVSDQLSRLRRLFGDERLAGLLTSRGGRPARFAMYTSRTPYPGDRTGSKDASRVKPLLDYYVGLLNAPHASGEPNLVRELQERGRWPAKDLVAFLGTTGERWDKRLRTQASDRELLTRHEVQRTAPDILVTNYSMLEYMMLRPIERSIFDGTREWLSDPANTFVLVLDEAHMYRGASGAEVAFLIRRLQARLGIDRDQMLCILTSASLGTGAEAEAAIGKFASELVGRRASGRGFEVIRGVRQQRPSSRAATMDETAAYGRFDLPTFLDRANNYTAAVAVTADLASQLGWAEPPRGVVTSDLEIEPLRPYLYSRLNGDRLAEELIAATSYGPTTLSELATRLFPEATSDAAAAATAALLALGTYAHNGERSLFPTRAHLMFRGLPGIFACVNPSCDVRRTGLAAQELLGRLYTEPREHCECSMHGRVYELYTHRDCGASFLRVFGRGERSDFYWHERGGVVGEQAQPLTETWLLLEEPHPDRQADVQPLWLDIATGRVSIDPPADQTGWRHAFRPAQQDPQTNRRRDRYGDRVVPFRSCPACTRTSGYKIMDLATKGEQPFANLVRSQFLLQPGTRPTDDRFPNGGRKVLLFSDGRQKAARLARDLPREVEFDTFREALVLAAHRMNVLNREAVLNERLYIAFLDVVREFHLNFFDRERGSFAMLRDHVRQYKSYYGGSLEDALDDEDWRPRPPVQYSQALLRQLSDPFYSLYAACAAVIVPTRSAARRFERNKPAVPQLVEEGLASLSTAWLQAILDRTAFDPRISSEMRRMVDAFHRPVVNGRVPPLERILTRVTSLDAKKVAEVEAALLDVFTQSHDSELDGGRHIDPSTVALRLALDDDWWYCNDCGLSQYFSVFQRCANCESSRLEARSPGHPYMTSRKGYFLEPLRAVLAGSRPSHLTAEEHTAQLSHRDKGVVYATTEEYELAFQDVVLGDEKPPVDVLSCTTTMEVGIDIGSLTAVGLRNVPPQRENYQQRAGRSGRRGAAVSTVVTFAQDGPHDNYYYENPRQMIGGEPRQPRVKIDNRRLAARHIHAYLLQTFFHGQLQSLTAEQQTDVATTRPGLLSTWGDASTFFTSAGPFSLQSLAPWVRREVLDRGRQLSLITNWLPDQVVSPDGAHADVTDAKARFVTETSARFLDALHAIRIGFGGLTVPSDDGTPPQPNGQGSVGESDSESGLLDFLFDRGLLPSYAFPTDLCSFNVFELLPDQDRVRVKEKPQQGKDLALSEYAPGRLLVVNKETYRVGGIYEEGGDPAHPARQWFEHPLDTYVYCSYCTYVRTEPLQSPEERCPVCHEQLTQNEILDPPGFAPERGRALRERDRDQEISYATSAQFPIPLGMDDFRWAKSTEVRVQFAYEENRRLIVVNKGPGEHGFSVCEECGASWPATEQSGDEHWRPYLIPSHVMRREGITGRCQGPLHPNPIYLGYTFLSDLLIARIELGAPLRYGPRDPWLHDALRSAAEAMVQATSRLLDIDPDELDSGYRLLPPIDGAGYVAAGDIYLFDTASGGAGYAALAGERLGEVLQAAETLASTCPANCQRSCTRCLRHYGNRYWHNRLDRFLAQQLIAYARTGTTPRVDTPEEQANRLRPLRRYLELEGWDTQELVESHGVRVPLAIRSRANPSRTLAVGTSPALTDREDPAYEHDLYRLDSVDNVETFLLNDYVLSRDLPTAYQEVRARL